MCADREHPADIIFRRHPGFAENLEKHRLTDRDLRFLVRAVYEVVGNWEGIALCLKVNIIDKIKKEYRGPEKRMIAILSAWLKGQTIEGKAPNLSWKSVVRVVADRVGGENPAHAEYILLNYNKFCTPSKKAAQVSNSLFVPAGSSNQDIQSKATDLQKDLGEVEHRWYQLGVLLGLPVHTLDGFQENYDELSERLRAMLQEWLKKGNTEEYAIPSRQVLVDAVEHSAGGANPRLAGELAKVAEEAGAGSTSMSTDDSTTASAPVPTVQSPAQPSSSLPSGQQHSMYQTPPTHPQQNPQMATPSQIQQPLDRLTAQDLYILTSILKAAAPQWKTIGDALGFVDSELTIIQRKPLLISEGDTGYFREMLSQWLKWAPPNHYWPTITALESAIQGSGHEGLANNFRIQFLQKKDHSNTSQYPPQQGHYYDGSYPHTSMPQPTAMQPSYSSTQTQLPQQQFIQPNPWLHTEAGYAPPQSQYPQHTNHFPAGATYQSPHPQPPMITQQLPYFQPYTGHPYPLGGSHGNVHPSQYTGVQMPGPSYQVNRMPASAATLTPDDMRILKPSLQPVAAYWVAIADQLGMGSHVSIIRGTHSNTNPPACLRDLLHRWLNQGHPTLEALCQALRNDAEIIGGDRVATKLEEQFKSRL